MTSKEKKDLKIELKSRQLVLKKLETARRALEKTCTRIQSERARREAEISEYKNEDEIADAYGWGFISEEEYDDLLERFREGREAIRNEKSAEEIAAEILSGWIRITEDDIQSLRFDLLSDEKKEEIRNKKTSEEIAAEILSGWIRITEDDIQSLRFDLLSDEKKEEIRQGNYEIAQRREVRRKNHDS